MNLTPTRPSKLGLVSDLMPSLSYSNRRYVIGVTLFMKTDLIIAGTFIEGREKNFAFDGWKDKEIALRSFSEAYREKCITPIYKARIFKHSIINPAYKTKVSVVYVSLGEALAALPNPIKNSEWHKEYDD